MWNVIHIKRTYKFRINIVYKPAIINMVKELNFEVISNKLNVDWSAFK
jgi:hypothetical protein